jgi:hypothetical protein
MSWYTIPAWLFFGTGIARGPKATTVEQHLTSIEASPRNISSRRAGVCMPPPRPSAAKALQ